MINYNKNRLINECLRRFYETFAHTLDTADYIPAKYNDKILAYIFKNMKKQFKKIDRADRRYQKQVRAKVKAKRGGKNVRKEENPVQKQIGEDSKECKA